MIDEEDDATVDLMTFLRPDTSGNRGGNPAASRTLSRAPTYPYDKPVSYGRQYYQDASHPTTDDIPGPAHHVWEDDEPSLADHFGLMDHEDDRDGLYALLSNNLISDR